MLTTTKCLLKDDRGEGYVEFLVVLPIVLIVIGMLGFFGRFWYAHLAAEEAAFDCTRTAIEAMEQGQGVWQGAIAGRNGLQGFNLDPSVAQIRVVPVEDWSRGGWVMCEVGYGINLRGVPFARWLAPDPTYPVRARYWGRVQEFKSDW